VHDPCESFAGECLQLEFTYHASRITHYALRFTFPLVIAPKLFHLSFVSEKSSRLKKFIQSWLINTLAVLVAVFVVPGIHFKDHSLITPFVVSLVLGILNAFIRPILVLVALPLLILTLGLFMLVINALLLYLVGIVLQSHFQVDGFGPAFLGALVISIVSLCLNVLTGSGNARVEFRRHNRPPPKSDDSGDGPVIDV